MPARDPTASPHLPTSLSNPNTLSPPPVLPTHSQPSPIGIGTSAPSRYSSLTFTSQLSGGSPSESPAARRNGREGTVVQALRRISLGHIPTDSALQDDEAGSSHISTRSRRRTQDMHDERPPAHTSPSVQSYSSQAIRDSSNRLASLSFTARPRRRSSASGSSGDNGIATSPLSTIRVPPDHRPIYPSHLAVSTNEHGISPSKGGLPGSGGNAGRSTLSVMLEREDEKRRQAEVRHPTVQSAIPEVEEDSASPQPDAGRLDSTSSSSSEVEGSGDGTPVARRGSLVGCSKQSEEEVSPSSSMHQSLPAEDRRDDLEVASERTPLLTSPTGRATGVRNRAQLHLRYIRQRVSKITARDMARNVLLEPVKTLPCVILGVLLNVLDGVSYGMILFPANPVFEDFGSLGVSMFFVSCIVSQLVFSLGGSVFPGGNGSMMIEAVPFFHILVNIIEAEIGDDRLSIIATTMVAFAFSSILTGVIFFALGAFRLGSLVGYFPRHILVGCIGGVGVFLIETGLEVSRGLKGEGFEYNLATLKLFFASGHIIALWTIPLALAILLRVITHFFHHQLIFPAYFFTIPVIFYVIVAIGGWDLETLRASGWVFDVGKNTQAWWKFYTYFDFSRTNWGAFWAAMPTQLALVFFGILHVPLNVPALGVSLCEDNVKLDRELVAHGVSNLAAGLTGTVPNYLCYVNTVLFYRVGGGSRLSGLMLSAATAAVLFVGPSVIAYLPIMLVGALIFVLGIDLTIEAIWDTRKRVNRTEYITIWAIAIGMTLWDFVIGLLFGIVLACVFFVVQNSRRRAIRTVFNGATAKSTVRRPRSQRAFIQQVGSQTYVMKLQGFLFFGTISTVEDEIRKLLEVAKWQASPIRFLIIDLGMVHGLDFSSAEAFVRVQRLLAAKDVLLILCGAAPNGLVGTALRGVDLWADREGTHVEVFAGLNDALEWTENAYLTAFYDNQDEEEAETAKTIDFPKISKPPFSLAESFENSPRRSHLAKAGDDNLPRRKMILHVLQVSPDIRSVASAYHQPTLFESEIHQPLPILLQTFGSYSEETTDFFAQLAQYFSQQIAHTGDVLWRQGDRADGLYLIESGSLRATYAYNDHRELVQETMVAGTIAGDLSTLSDTSRNATVVAERECVLWKLDKEGLARLEEERGGVARRFIRIVLKAVAEEQDVLSSHLIAVLS